MIRTLIVTLTTLLFVALNITGCQSPADQEIKTEVEIVTTEEVVVETEEVLPIPFGNIQVTDIEQVLLENPDATLLDVRTEMENEEDAIPNSVVIPVQELEERISELNKDNKYIVYCRSGNRSSQAIEILKNEGFTKLFHMLGGMNKYRQTFPK